VVQDNRGFKSTFRVHGFKTDISTDGGTLSVLYGLVAALGTALQAATNAKIVETGVQFDWSIAQEPSSETGTYQLVTEQAILRFGDGTVNLSRAYVPAPKDGLFLTGSSDNLIVVNPVSTELTNLQAAGNALWLTSAGSPVWSQFFGGQLVGRKPRVRRVLQGA
jgi:hypothetical protein